MKEFQAKSIKWLLIGLSSVLFLTACGNSNKDNAKKDSDSNTITIFDKNAKSAKFDDRIAKLVEEKTGIKVKIQNPTGDPESKLSLMLAGKDYPDIVIMDRRSDIITKYIESNALLPLNELIDKEGDQIKEMYGDILGKTRHTDGKNYYLSNWYGKSEQPVQAVTIRYDLLVEIVGKERADSTQPFTQQEYVEILKQFKEKHPEIDGKESIPVTFNPEDKNVALEGMFGIKTYNDQEGKLSWKTTNPQYMEMLKFVNQIQRDELLDKEWVSNKYGNINQKLASNNVFSFIGSYDSTTANETLSKSVGEDAQYIAYKVLGNNISEIETTYGGRSSLGWDGIGITDNCENVEAAMKLVNFLSSREGQTLLLWGVEGEDYTIGEDGAYIPTEDRLKAYTEDSAKAVTEFGVTRWTWFVNNQGPNDKTPTRLTDYIYNEKPTEKRAWENLTDTYWDTSEYENLLPEGSTPLGLKAQKIQDIVDQNFAKFVNAKDEKEMTKLYETMTKDMEASGVKEVEKEINSNFKAKQKLEK